MVPFLNKKGRSAPAQQQVGAYGRDKTGEVEMGRKKGALID
jgi:hypothetical protein